jgi:hypothetical protein
MIEPQSVRRAFSRKITTGVLAYLGAFIAALLAMHAKGQISETLARALIEAALLYGLGQTGVYMTAGVFGLREDTRRAIKADETKPEAQL